MKEGILFVVYVDDAIFAGTIGELLEAEIAKLGDCSAMNVHSFQLRNEGDVGNILHIRIKNTGPGDFSLTQPGLIEKVIKFTEMSDAMEYILQPQDHQLGPTQIMVFKKSGNMHQ